MTVGYLTSLYARGTDSFIRGEVRRLRELGVSVRTYSIRRPPASEATDDSIAEEQQRTYYLLEQGVGKLTGDVILSLATRIRGSVAALVLALRTAQPGLRGLCYACAYWIEAAALARAMKRDGIVHLHNHIGQNSATVAMLASMISGIPYSLTIHGPLEFDRPAALAIGEKVRRSLFTVAVSDYGRSQLMRWTPRDAWGRIHVVRCGVQPEYLDGVAVGDLPPRSHKFVCIGRLAEQKGIPVLIDAARMLRAEGLVFEIALVGDGPLRCEIESQIESSGLAGSVRVVGLLSPAMVRDELLTSRALVMPSFAEGLPVAMMEALALGRPVIGTYIAGVPELVRPGETGWLVPAGSSLLLAEAMKQALQASNEELAAMGRRGSELVRREHDQRSQAQKLAGLLNVQAQCAGAAA